ncbi:zinc-binding metallopeptidase family protein [Actinoplanes siamensis]|uniref:hypothetical protein n=1 Tax=Actinoplanes siamensis TaxID=1223317 RepID=UPI00360C2134
MTTTALGFLTKHRDAVVAELAEWVRIPSVAGIPEHLVDLRRSATWLAAALRETGFPSVEVWDTQGGPEVYAEWCAEPGAPTVLIYSHHDVRAAKDEEWDETARRPGRESHDQPPRKSRLRRLDILGGPG